jgi:O-succinylbenzoate synthase
VVPVETGPAGTLASEDVLVFAIPMPTRFRGVEVREGVLWRGPAGWTEWNPFWDYADAEALAWLDAADDSAALAWPAPVRTRIPVNCTVPAVGPEQARAVVDAAHGCRTAKVKVAEPGQRLDDDLARVAAVRDALGDGGRVRVDANGGWTLVQARTALTELAVFDLEYVEQPCRTVAELAAVRSWGIAPVAADESIRRARDPLAVARAGAADIAVLKVSPLGGVRACLEIAERAGLPVVVSSAVDTSVGLAAGLALAAALPDLPYACGLGTRALLGADVVADDASGWPVDGELTVGRRDVDPNEFDAVRADRRTTARWLERLARVRALQAARASA